MVFDAPSIGDVNPKGKRMQQLLKMPEAIGEAAASGDARADHRLHLRCEVSQSADAGGVPELVEHPLVQLVSVMDHAPGQRQFARLEKYREDYQGKYHLSDAEMDAFIVEQVANSERYSDAARAIIVDVRQERGLSVASHDDATLAHVRESAGYGMAIAEFPDHRGGRQGQPRARPAGADGRPTWSAAVPTRATWRRRNRRRNRRAGYPFPATTIRPACCMRFLLAGEHSEYDAIRCDLPQRGGDGQPYPGAGRRADRSWRIRVGLRADLPRRGRRQQPAGGASGLARRAESVPMTGRLIYLMGLPARARTACCRPRASPLSLARLPYRAAGDHAPAEAVGRDAQAVTPGAVRHPPRGPGVRHELARQRPLLWHSGCRSTSGWRRATTCW